MDVPGTHSLVDAISAKTLHKGRCFRNREIVDLLKLMRQNLRNQYWNK